jgi:hypothetical protein
MSDFGLLHVSISVLLSDHGLVNQYALGIVSIEPVLAEKSPFYIALNLLLLANACMKIRPEAT